MALLVALAIQSYFQGLEPSGHISFDGWTNRLLDAFLLAVTIVVGIHANNALKKLAKVERQSSLQKINFAIALHDARNALGVALLGSQMLADELSGDPDLRDVSTRVIWNLQNVESITTSMSEISQCGAEAGLAQRKQQSDLGAIVAKVVDACSIDQQAKIRVNQCPSILGVWSAEGIERALKNLVINARKYGMCEQPIDVALTREGDRAKLSVHNWGKAIPACECEEIFEVYARSSDAICSTVAGSGLGLASVKEIVTAHGGSVAVDSSMELGTTFTMTLPIRVSDIG